MRLVRVELTRFRSRRAIVLLVLAAVVVTIALAILTAYQTHERGLSRSCADAQFLADAIGVAVLGGMDSGDDDDQLWATRDQVSQATGMVVAQLKIAPPDALALLRAHAFAHGTTVVDVSRGVLARKLDFTSEGQGDQR